MKTLEEVFDEVAESEELQAKFMVEQTAEKWVALVKELGGDTTVEEITPYLSDWGNKEGILSDESLEQVVGGYAPTSGRGREVVPEQRWYFLHEIHPDCGGHIANHNNPFKKCKCEKCGTKHYWYDNFFNWK